jgi:hypothetical protein
LSRKKTEEKQGQVMFVRLRGSLGRIESVVYAGAMMVQCIKGEDFFLLSAFFIVAIIWQPYCIDKTPVH